MARLKDKLSALERPQIEMTLKSADSRREVAFLYQRPTEIVDAYLKQQLNDEYEAAMDSLKESKNGKKSTRDVLYDQFVEGGKETSANSLLTKELKSIREEVIRQIQLDPPEEDASQEVKDEFMAEFRPAFEDELTRRRTRYCERELADLAHRATEMRLSEIALERATQIYRRSLVAHAIYERLEDDRGEATGEVTLAFESEHEVAEFLPSDTIDKLADRIIEELNRARSLPLKSAAKTS